MACRLRRLSAAAHSAHPIHATAPRLRKILDRGAGKVPSRATWSRHLPVAGAMTAGQRAAMRGTRKNSAGGKGRPAGDGAGRCAFRCLRAPGHQRKCPAEAGHRSCRLPGRSDQLAIRVPTTSISTRRSGCRQAITLALLAPSHSPALVTGCASPLPSVCTRFGSMPLLTR